MSRESNARKLIDTAIVGAGPAGLSAALFLGRAGCSVVVFDDGPSRITVVDRVREFIGFDGIAPHEMLSRMRTEVRHYGVPLRAEHVHRVEPRADGSFDVHTPQGTITARTIVLATGLKDELPELEGLTQTWGNDLRVCPCFDGHEVRNQRFVVFGVHERLAHLASWVSVWSPHVTVVTPKGLEPSAMERLGVLDIPVIHDEISGLVRKDGHVMALASRNGKEVACDAAWIAMKWRAASGLAASLCEVDEAGIATVDVTGKTSRPGVFAVGNASNAVAHVAHAVADGANVGPHVTTYLLEKTITAKRSLRRN